MKYDKRVRELEERVNILSFEDCPFIMKDGKKIYDFTNLPLDSKADNVFKIVKCNKEGLTDGN